MIKNLPSELKQFKHAGDKEHVDGHYRIPHPWIQHYHFLIVASSNFGWEHVSVSIVTFMDKHKKKKLLAPAMVDRCPTWEEMCFIKATFWNEDEAVVQFHPPESDYVNLHPHCLHLWKPTEFTLALPPSILVGPKGENDRKLMEALLGKLIMELEEVNKRLPHCKEGPEKNLMEAAKEDYEKKIAHIKTQLKDVTTEMAEESDSKKDV